MKAPKHVSQILIVFLVMACLAGNVSGMGNVSMGITPELSQAGANETFIINVNVNPNDNSIYGIQFDLYFDPSLLEAKKIEKGQLLSQDASQTVNIPRPINNSIGKIEYAETRIGIQTGVKNPGTLAAITFTVKQNAKIDAAQSFSLKNVNLTDNNLNPITADVSSGEFKVIKAGTRTQNLTSQMTPERGQVISPELLAEMNKKADIEKISIKISVDQKDLTQNLLNLATFLNSRGTDVSDINQLADSLTCKASKRLINEISGLSYITEITTYKEAAPMPAQTRKQPGFGAIITVAILLLMCLKFKKINNINRNSQINNK